jgi:tRNA (cmo5U34)-methyltransferase
MPSVAGRRSDALLGSTCQFFKGNLFLARKCYCETPATRRLLFRSSPVASNPLPMRQLYSDLWVVEQPLTFMMMALGTRMTVIRLGDGSLFLHSPVELDDDREPLVHAAAQAQRGADYIAPAQRLARGGRNRYSHRMAQAVRKAFAVGADTYDRAHRKLVPCFDDFYRAALELLPFKPDDRFEALDLGAGTGLLSAMIAEVFPKAQLTLFDLTPEMLMIARQRLKPLGKRVRFVTADFAEAAPSKSYDAVVSALAIHHLPDSGKRHLFADIFKYLTSGGVFVNADQVAGETAAIDQRSRQMWIKRARELKVGERDLKAALERMKQDLPATVGQQLAWMRESGFIEVSCAYRNLIFAVLSGIRPVNALEARFGATQASDKPR